MQISFIILFMIDLYKYNDVNFPPMSAGGLTTLSDDRGFSKHYEKMENGG